MRKCWVWPIVLVGVISYLYLNFAPPPENKSTHLVSVTTLPEIKKSAITHPPSRPKEPRPSVTSLDNIQAATVSYPTKQPSYSSNPCQKAYLKSFLGKLKVDGDYLLGNNHRLNKAIIKDLIISGQALYSVDSPFPYGIKLIQVLKDRV